MVKYRWVFFLVQVRVTDRKIYWDTIHLHCDKKGNSTKIKLTFFFLFGIFFNYDVSILNLICIFQYFARNWCDITNEH